MSANNGAGPDNSTPRPQRGLRGLNTRWQESRDTAPLPLLRWGALLAMAVGVAVARWAKGVPHDVADAWPALAIALVLVLPDLGSLAFGSLKLEMRQTKAEVERLGNQIQQVQQGQSQKANASSTSGVSITANELTIVDALGTLVGRMAPGEPGPGAVGATPDVGVPSGS